MKSTTSASQAAEMGMKTTLLGIVVNAILAIVKGTAGVLGHSYALIADAIESASDIFSSLIIWTGLKIAVKPADKNHPYGHGKAEPLAASIVAVILIGAALLIAIQSIREIFNPHYSPAPFTLTVLVVVIVTKELLFRYVIKTGEHTQSLAVKTDAWHHRSDMLTSAAAFIGISIALIGGSGYESADDYAALFAAAVIFFNASNLLRPAVGELMDEAPSDDVQRKIRKVALRVPGVMALDKCYVRKIGLNYYADLHIVVSGKMTVEKGHELSHRVEDAICASNSRIVSVLVHPEPFKKNFRRRKTNF